jgi:hypothetical protein
MGAEVNITEFLAARYDEDAAIALSAHPSPWEYTSRAPKRLASIGAPASTHGGRRVVILSDNSDRDMSVEHLLTWQPARVLAEVTAKRRIVELCATWMAEGERNLGGRDALSIAARTQAITADTVLRALVQPYADHTDFDPAWRA